MRATEPQANQRLASILGGPHGEPVEPCGPVPRRLPIVLLSAYLGEMVKNVFRFRKLKWGDPERPWLRRGPPLPPDETRRGLNLDSPLLILLGAVLAFGLGWVMFG